MSEIILETKNLCKKYGSFNALNGLDLTVESGKIIGLLGPNGSGKTTLIKLCNGLIQKSKGELKICGNDIGVACWTSRNPEATGDYVLTGQ